MHLDEYFTPMLLELSPMYIIRTHHFIGYVYNTLTMLSDFNDSGVARGNIEVNVLICQVEYLQNCLFSHNVVTPIYFSNLLIRNILRTIHHIVHEIHI